MAAFHSKGFISKCKLRINQKLWDIIEEAENTSSLLDEEVSKLKEIEATFQSNEDANCYGVYQEIKNILENFSEKLFLINNILRPDTVDSCSPITCDVKQVTQQSNFNVVDSLGSKCEFKSDAPQNPMASIVTTSTSAYNQNSASAPVVNLPSESTNSVSCEEILLSRMEDVYDNEKSENSSISENNVDQTSNESMVLGEKNIVQKASSQDTVYYSISSGTKSSFYDTVTLLNNGLSNSDQETHLSSSSTTIVNTLEAPLRSTGNPECFPEAANSPSINEIPSPVVEIGSYICARITEFKDPSEFWLQLWDLDDSFEDLFKLETYTRLDPSAMKSHGYCMAPLKEVKDIIDMKEQYQRACIINFFGSGDNSTVVVFFVDYGCTRLIESQKLQVMPRSFRSQPARAIPCYLYGVVPPPTSYKWSNEAQEKILEVASRRNKVFIVAEKDGKFAVDFIIPLPAGEETCNLSDYMCCLELAMPALNSDVASVNKKLPDENIGVNDTNLATIAIEKESTKQDYDWNFKIPPPELSFLEENKMLVVPSAIFSPSEFYVNPACESGPDFDSVQQKMNEIYNRTTSLMEYQVSGEQLQPGMFCCSQLNDDGCWYRAKILSIYTDEKSNGKLALIQLVDYGDRSSTPVVALRPLVKEFAALPAFSILCSLALVSPKDDKGWTEDTIKKFKEILGFDKFYKAEFFANKELPDGRIALDMFLHDSMGNVARLINQILIEKGLADEVDIIPRESEAVKSLDDAFLKWDPMTDDFSSIKNSYKISTDDVEMVIDGYKRKDERVICKFFAEKGRCRRHSCRFLHIHTGEDTATREREALTLPLGNEIPLPNPQSTVMGQISHIIDPAHFYLILPYGSSPVNELHHSKGDICDRFPEYEILESAMNFFYTGSALNEVTALALSLGTIVAAKYSKADLWLRARVLDEFVGVDEKIKVFFVDKGMTDWVQRKWIREMEPEYLFAPFQAVECFLSNIEPKSSENDGKWSSQSRTFFKNLLEGKMLVVFVDQRIGTTLHVRLKLMACDGAVLIDDVLVHADYAQYMSSKDKCEVKLKHSKNGIVEDLSSVTQPG